jgi:hypothetical protein
VTDYDRKSGRLSFSAKIEGGEFSFKGKVAPQVIEGDLVSPWEPPRRIKLEETSSKLANEPEAKCK